MLDPDDKRATEIILAATGRPSLSEALAWLAEDGPVAQDLDWSEVLRAIVRLRETGQLYEKALRRAVREATRSDVDTAKVIFDADNLPDPGSFRRAIAELRKRSETGTLEGLTPRSILRAQYSNELCLETLCLIAGVTITDAQGWFGVSGSTWTESQVASLLTYLDDLLADRITSSMPNSVPARAVELISTSYKGWAGIEDLIDRGVPYEFLLTQRVVGGGWLAHKNRTSNFPNISAADKLCAKLGEKGIDFRRSSTVGGESKQSDLQKLSGIYNKRVGVVILKDYEPKFAVAFSSARDGGTARANGDGLLQLPTADVPLGLVLTGLGWMERSETDRLATKFDGHLYTEHTVEQLVAEIVRVS